MGKRKAEARRLRRNLEKKQKVRQQKKKERADSAHDDVDIAGTVAQLMEREAALDMSDEGRSGAAPVRSSRKAHAIPDSNWKKVRTEVGMEKKPVPKRKRRRVHPVAVSQENYDTAARLPQGDAQPTKVIAMDCEMVGVGAQGKTNSLARVSIINFHGHVLLDTFVTAKEKVTDYRTQYSGVRAEHLTPANSMSFTEAQGKVHKLLASSIVVGHSLHHDLSVLMLSHPWRDVRDVSKYRPLLDSIQAGKATPSLKRMAAEILGRPIQQSEHDSVEDSRAALDLYRRVAQKWERELS